jgi:hypothetical protein
MTTADKAARLVRYVRSFDPTTPSSVLAVRLALPKTYSVVQSLDLLRSSMLSPADATRLAVCLADSVLNDSLLDQVTEVQL